MRIGIIGAGGQAMAHGAALQVVDGLDLAAMAGRGRKSLKRAAGEVGASAAESPAALIADATIDGVIIACPTAHHRDYAVAALEAGKHVFCEFPLAPSLADADAMIAAARQAGRQSEAPERGTGQQRADQHLRHAGVGPEVRAVDRTTLQAPQVMRHE